MINFIKLPMFNTHITVAIKNKGDALRLVDRIFEKELMPMNGEGATIICFDEGSEDCYKILIWANEYSLTTIAHEVVHAVNMIFHAINYHSQEDNDEIQAYLVGYIVGEIEKAYKASVPGTKNPLDGAYHTKANQ